MQISALHAEKNYRDGNYACARVHGCLQEYKEIPFVIHILYLVLTHRHIHILFSPAAAAAAALPVNSFILSFRSFSCLIFRTDLWATIHRDTHAVATAMPSIHTQPYITYTHEHTSLIVSVANSNCYLRSIHTQRKNLDSSTEYVQKVKGKLTRDLNRIFFWLSICIQL